VPAYHAGMGGPDVFVGSTLFRVYIGSLAGMRVPERHRRYYKAVQQQHEC